MLNRTAGALLWGAAVLLGTAPMLLADTAAGMRAFRNKDYSTAYREWKAAASQGQAEAQYNLGLLYLKGLGVTKDPAEAFRWFHLAADQGQADAQFQVGLMREKGVGVQPPNRGLISAPAPRRQPEIAAAKSVTIDVDRRRMKRVLVNLLVNVLEVMPDGGAIHIAAAADVEWVIDAGSRYRPGNRS